MDKSKRFYFKSKWSFRRRLPPIGLGDQIDYRNMSLISQFISEQGKILSRWVNRLNLKQQRLITIATNQTRILSLLSFLNNEKQFERGESAARTVGLRLKKGDRLTLHLNQNSNTNSKADWCFVRKICKLRCECHVIRKKGSGKKNKSFFIECLVCSFWWLYHIIWLYFIILISILPSRS